MKQFTKGLARALKGRIAFKGLDKAAALALLEKIARAEHAALAEERVLDEKKKKSPAYKRQHARWMRAWMRFANLAARATEKGLRV